MAGDIEAAHYYHLEEELHQQRKESAEGINTIMKGAMVCAVALLLLFAKWMELFVILILVGVIFLASGVVKHLNYDERKAKPQERAKEKAKYIDVSVHHIPAEPHHLVTRPHQIIRHSFQRSMPFAFAFPAVNEQELAKKIIRENSGSSISTLYRLYQLEGGKLDQQGFARALHDMRKRGLIKVQKHINFVDVEHVAAEPAVQSRQLRKGAA